MELYINQQKKTFDTEQISVQQLLDLECPVCQQGIAIAIENKVIPKSAWVTTLLLPLQRITIITATQGG